MQGSSWEHTQTLPSCTASSGHACTRPCRRHALFPYWSACSTTSRPSTQQMTSLHIPTQRVQLCMSSFTRAMCIQHLHLTGVPQLPPGRRPVQQCILAAGHLRPGRHLVYCHTVHARHMGGWPRIQRVQHQGGLPAAPAVLRLPQPGAVPEPAPDAGGPWGASKVSATESRVAASRPATVLCCFHPVIPLTLNATEAWSTRSAGPNVAGVELSCVSLPGMVDGRMHRAPLPVCACVHAAARLTGPGSGRATRHPGDQGVVAGTTPSMTQWARPSSVT